MGVYFDSSYEQESIDSGIAAQQQETGVVFNWFFFNATESRISTVYDEAAPSAPTVWKGPYPIPVLQVTRNMGSLQSTGEGAYVVDSITAVLGYRQAVDAGLLPAPDRTRDHLKDRFVWDGKVWAPSAIVARNQLGGRGTRATILVTATEERDDEMLNDPAFARYVEHDYVRPEPGHVV